MNLKEKYEKSLKLYENFWEIYDELNVKLGKACIKRIKNQEYADNYIKKIINCIKFFNVNFDKNEYHCDIYYNGYGDTKMHLDVMKKDDDSCFTLHFGLSGESCIRLITGTTIEDNQYKPLKDIEKLNDSFIGTMKYNYY